MIQLKVRYEILVYILGACRERESANVRMVSCYVICIYLILF